MSVIAVIGGGLGGLAAAIRLAHAGHRVVLHEKNDAPGGKMARLAWEGFRWDMGPSLLTMPQVVRELWAEVGRDPDEDIELIPLERTCRYRWTDGTVIDEDAAFWARPDVAAYIREARGVHDLSSDAFLRHAPDEMGRVLRADRLPLLRHFPKVADPRPLHRLNTSFFRDAHVLQIFDRFATYNGSSPYRTPSVFRIIPYVQAAFGGHYPRGGMRALAVAMTRLAEDLGVAIHCGSEIRQVRWEGGAHRVIPADGSASFLADRVVCNMDAVTARDRLFAGLGLPRRRVRAAPDPSTSGFILFLAMDRPFPGLDHHNILFSDDYPGEFRQLAEGRPADQPTVYIAVGSRTDPSLAPPGKESWFVLVNAPATGGFDWSRGADGYAERVLDRIGAFGMDARPHILHRRLFTPEDFEARDRAWRGTLYGFASHGLLSSFRRPAVAPPDLPGVYFVGGTTHPGGGVPLVLLGGRIVANKILESF